MVFKTAKRFCSTPAIFICIAGQQNSGRTKKRKQICLGDVDAASKAGWKEDGKATQMVPKLSPNGPKVPKIIPKRSQNSPELVPKRPSMTPEMVPKWSAACSLCDFSTSTLFLRQRRFFPLGCDFCYIKRAKVGAFFLEKSIKWGFLKCIFLTRNGK